MCHHCIKDIPWTVCLMLGSPLEYDQTQNLHRLLRYGEKTILSRNIILRNF